jgi:DNA repair exonuclease SbcCD ATPase subunit
LDAFIPSEDESELPSPARTKHLDVVHSEDIEGPSDFTQNLEYWMTTKLPNVTRPSRMTGQARDDLEQYVSEHTEIKSPQRHVQEKKDSLVEDTQTPRKEGDGLSFFSNIPSSLRPEEAQASTPQTVEHVSAASKKGFQASVEDHEDTPSRLQSSSAIDATLRSPEFTLKSRPSYLQQEMRDDDEETETETETVKSLRDALEQLRQELHAVRTMSQQDLDRAKLEHEEELRQQKNTQESQMQAQEREWARQLSATKHHHAQQLEQLQALSVKEGENHLADDKLERMTKNLSAKAARILQLESEVAKQDNDLREAEVRETTLQQERDAAIENHRTMLVANTNAQHTQALRLQELQVKHTELLNSKIELERKAHSLEADMANLHIQHANEIEALAFKTFEAAEETQDARLSEQQASLSTIGELEQENQHLHDQLDGKDDEIDALSKEVQQLRVRSNLAVGEKDKLAAKLKEQKTLNDQAAREIQSLRSGTKILQARLNDAEKQDADSLETMEAQLAEANAARLESDAEVDELKEQLSVIKASLATSQSETLAAKEDLARYKEDNELINKSMDKRMRELMRAREAEWARRLEALRKEAGFRGEVLMREWGRAELGVSEPQGYRYKCV